MDAVFHFCFSVDCPNLVLYLLKLQIVFVEIAKCICGYCQMYLLKLQILFWWLTESRASGAGKKAGVQRPFVPPHHPQTKDLEFKE